MKIVFDCRYTRFDRHDGISRYTSRLVEELAKLHDVTMMIYDERQLALLPDLPWVRGPHPRGLKEPFASMIANQWAPDVVFSPMQMIGPFRRRFALVTTMHDLIYYRHPTPPRNIAWPLRVMWRLYHLRVGFQSSLLNQADWHVTDSETTKELMVSHALTRNPISVIHLGSDLDVVTEPRRVPEAKQLVYMGSFMPYKNVELLISAMHLLPGYQLHLMSRLDAGERERLLANAPAGSVVVHNGATDEVYLELLRRATALVTASRDEGFGLPVAESMAVGTPVVVSDIPIFHEIAGDAAGYFDPDDAASFAREVLALENAELWQQRSTASVQRATHFTWAEAASNLSVALASAIERRNAQR